MSFCKQDGKVMSISYRNTRCFIIAHIEDCLMLVCIAGVITVWQHFSFILHHYSSH